MPLAFQTQLVQSENDYISTGYSCTEPNESLKELRARKSHCVSPFKEQTKCALGLKRMQTSKRG